MLKKLFVLAAAVLLFTGCTTVDSTLMFNGMNLGTDSEKAVCQTYVNIPGYYWFGLPLIVGSAKGDGQFTFFRFNLTNENVVFLLTRTVKSLGATRMINVQVHSTEQPLIFPGLSYRTMQGSATGIRNKGAAMRQAAKDYDALP